MTPSDNCPPEVAFEIKARLLTGHGGRDTRDGELLHHCTAPGHKDEHPSSCWNVEKHVFNCLSCGDKGGWMVMCDRLGIDKPVLREKRMAGKSVGRAVDTAINAVVSEPRSSDAGPTEGETLPRAPMPPGRTEYVYRRPDGTLTGIVKVRTDWADGDGKPHKTFAWTHDGEPGLPADVSSKDMLYGLESLKRPGPVYVVEGERAAAALHNEGHPAVATGCGSAVTPSDKALAPLNGRICWLWPDNDEKGLEHMRAIAEKLGKRAEVWLMAWTAAPPKGDAADWCALWEKSWDLHCNQLGSPQNLGTDELPGMELRVRRLYPKIVAEATDEATVSLDISDEKGDIRIMANNVIETPSGLKASLRITTDSDEPWESRLNLSSSQDQDHAARLLQQYFESGDKRYWLRIMNRAASAVDKARSAYGDAIDIMDAPLRSLRDQYRVQDYVEAGEPNMFFGDGGAGKGYLVASLAAHIALGRNFCGRRVLPGRVLYLDAEANSATQRFRMERVCRGMGVDPEMLRGKVGYLSIKGRTLDQALDLINRKSVDLQGAYDVAIIDSVVPACGGDPLAPEGAMSFFRALSRMTIKTTISIGHVTKDGVDTVHPFGSIFWHNEMRRTFYVSGRQSGNAVSLTLKHRKKNNGPQLPDTGFELTFDDTEIDEFHKGPVAIRSVFVDPSWAEQGPTRADQILAALAGGPKSPGEIALAVNKANPALLPIEQGSVSKELTSLKGHGKVVNLQRGLWALPKHQDELPSIGDDVAS